MFIHQLLRNLLTTFLAAIVLVSSSGLFMNKMVCLVSGNTFISFSAIDHCIPQGEESVAMAEKCCDYSQLLMKMKIEGNRQHEDLKTEVFATPIAVLLPLELPLEPVVQLQHAYLYADLPPPLPLSQQLALRQSFLI
jgi:hypothetical protein